MSTLVFVLIFVFLGLGTLLFAMSGGRGGLGSVLHSQSRGGRRFATFSLFASLALLGVAIPALIVSADANNDDIPHAGVTNLTPEEKHGQELFSRRCGLCHALEASNSVAQVGPDLDQLRPDEKMTLNAILNGVSRGGGQMPGGLYTGRDAEDVAKFVAKSVGMSDPSGG